MKYDHRSKVRADAQAAQRSIDELEARQRNILWSDTLRNSRIFSDILLKSPPGKKGSLSNLQGAGLVALALAFLAGAATLIYLALSERDLALSLLLALPLLYVGWRLLRYALRD